MATGRIKLYHNVGEDEAGRQHHPQVLLPSHDYATFYGGRSHAQKSAARPAVTLVPAFCCPGRESVLCEDSRRCSARIVPCATSYLLVGVAQWPSLQPVSAAFVRTS